MRQTEYGQYPIARVEGRTNAGSISRANGEQRSAPLSSMSLQAEGQNEAPHLEDWHRRGGVKMASPILLTTCCDTTCISVNVSRAEPRTMLLTIKLHPRPLV